jgi:NADH dehydrogenase
MGRMVAEIIANEVQDGPSDRRPIFYYKDKGSMATISRGKAVTTLGSQRVLGGFFGWLAWGAVHMFFLVNFRSRLSVMVEWFWNYLTGERRSRLIQGDPQLHVKKLRGARMFDQEIEVEE